MAGRAPIKIRIGASVDASVDRAFDHIEKRAQKAQDRVRQSSERANRAAEKAAERAARNQIRAQEHVASAEERSNRQRERAAERLATAKERAATRAALRQEREARRAARTEEREAQRAATASQRAHEAFARRTSHRTTRFLMPNAPIGSMAMRGLGQATRGMGVDASIASMFGRLGQRETMAVNLANAAYLPNAEEGNPNRDRVNADDLTQQATTVARQYGITGEDVLAGMGEYVKVAGDLAAARESIGDLAKLSVATGTALADMAAAAGNVDAQLGDIPNKGKVVADIMRTIAAQGKMGAVEISDMSTQMARVAAAAAKFEGDTGENIKKFGALAQISRGTGGAPSAAEASRAVVGFGNTLKKGARLKEFDAAGIDVYNDQNQMRDPFKIIEESLVATNGDPRKMNKLFMDVVGERALSGLTTTFNRAGGNEGNGIEEVRKQLAKFLDSATISDAELDESANRASNTSAAKANKFNEDLMKMSGNIRAKLIPALEQHSDTILRFAEVIGDVATWALENPKSAIAAAISASIARAGIESALRSGIETLIGAAGGGGAGVGGYTRGAGFMGGVGVAGNLAAGMTIAALAVTSVVIGRAIIDNLFDNSKKKDDEERSKMIEGWQSGGEANRAWQRGDFEEAIAAQKQRVAAADAEVDTHRKKFDEKGAFQKSVDWMLGLDTPLNNLMGTVGVSEHAEEVAREAMRAAQQDAQRQQEKLDKMIELLEQSAFLGTPIPGTDSGTE